MRRREFIALMGASVAWPFTAMAQEPGRSYRLGVLFAGPRSGDVVTAFFEGVRRQGFIEGQNLTVIYHALGINPDLLPEWVAELVKARVDVIAVAGNKQTKADDKTVAKVRRKLEATSEIPRLEKTTGRDCSASINHSPALQLASPGPSLSRRNFGSIASSIAASTVGDHPLAIIAARRSSTVS